MLLKLTNLVVLGAEGLEAWRGTLLHACDSSAIFSDNESADYFEIEDESNCTLYFVKIMKSI